MTTELVTVYGAALLVIYLSTLAFVISATWSADCDEYASLLARVVAPTAIAAAGLGLAASEISWAPCGAASLVAMAALAGSLVTLLFSQLRAGPQKSSTKTPTIGVKDPLLQELNQSNGKHQKNWRLDRTTPPLQ